MRQSIQLLLQAGTDPRSTDRYGSELRYLAAKTPRIAQYLHHLVDSSVPEPEPEQEEGPPQPVAEVAIISEAEAQVISKPACRVHACFTRLFFFLPWSIVAGA